MIAKNILELIGNTPLVQINNVYNKPKLKMYIKMEKFNVGGSVKDRIAKYMIEQAEKNGQLNKNKILIEPTSRNTEYLISTSLSHKRMPTSFSNARNYYTGKKKNTQMPLAPKLF